MTYDPDKLKVVGTRPVRPDGADKVTGRANFGADFSMNGQLVGKVLRSPHAHARIVRIDTSNAQALSGVKAIVTRKDFSEDVPFGPGMDGEMATWKSISRSSALENARKLMRVR